MDFSKISDAKLYQMCKEYGLNAKVWLRKFAGLLPEVYKRQLYKRRGFGSIYEFASKLAGMGQMTADKVLNLHQRLQDKPLLEKQFINGDVGWSKLEKVSFIATPETDQFWSEKVSTLPRASLEIFIQEIRKTASNFTPGSEGENISEISQGLNAVQWPRLSFPVSPQIQQELIHLKQRLEKEKKITLTWNDVMQFFLEYKDAAPQKEPVRIVQLCPSCIQKKEACRDEVTRHIPEVVKQLVFTRTEGRCAFRFCKNLAEHLHHTRRFSLVRNHDPRFLVALCKTHHTFVHSGLIANEELNPVLWKVRGQPERASPKYVVDKKMMERYQLC